MIQVATSANTLVNEINKLLVDSRNYWSRDNLTFRRLESEARKLLKANAAEGHNVLAQLYTLTGDIDEAIQHVDAAINLRYDSAIVCNKAGLLVNFGKFQAAQEWFERGAAPERGQFTARWKIGLCAGSFHTLMRFGATARKMELDLDQIDLATVERAVRIFDEDKIDDVRLGAIFDVAGELLREERVFFLGDGPEIFVWDRDAIERHVEVTFRLPVSSRRSIELDKELGRRLFAVGDFPFSILLHFESGLESDERFSERFAAAG